MSGCLGKIASKTSVKTSECHPVTATWSGWSVPRHGWSWKLRSAHFLRSPPSCHTSCLPPARLLLPCNKRLHKLATFGLSPYHHVIVYKYNILYIYIYIIYIYIYYIYIYLKIAVQWDITGIFFSGGKRTRQKKPMAKNDGWDSHGSTLEDFAPRPSGNEKRFANWKITIFHGKIVENHHF